MESIVKKHNSEWAVLAGLRFLLAFFVSITHLHNFVPNSILVHYMGTLGHASVFGFFMVSGYSIAASIQSRPEGYFFRRFKRIYPTYIFALIFTILLMNSGTLVSTSGQHIVPPSFKLIIQNLFMLQGIFAWALECNFPTWTLGIEWWCYMTAPLLIRIRNKILTWLGLIVFVVILLYGRYALGIKNSSNMTVYFDIFFRASAWVGGFAYYRERNWKTFILMILPAIVMFMKYLAMPYSIPLVLFCAFVIVMAPKIKIQNRTTRQISQWLGNMSYPYYLLHFPLLYAITAYTGIDGGTDIILVMLGIVGFGYYVVTILNKRFFEIGQYLKDSYLSRNAVSPML